MLGAQFSYTPRLYCVKYKNRDLYFHFNYALLETFIFFNYINESISTFVCVTFQTHITQITDLQDLLFFLCVGCKSIYINLMRLNK